VAKAQQHVKGNLWPMFCLLDTFFANVEIGFIYYVQLGWCKAQKAYALTNKPIIEVEMHAAHGFLGYDADFVDGGSGFW